MDKSNVLISLYRLLNNQVVSMNNGTSPGAVERVTMYARAHLKASEIPDAELIALAEETLPRDLAQAVLDYKAK